MMLSNRRIVDWWNGGVGGVVESSNCGMVEWQSWWNCRIVEWWNGGMVELMTELSNRLIIESSNGGV